MKFTALIGFFIILVGISILLRVIFHVVFPVFEVGLAIALIYLGVKMLLRTFGFSGPAASKVKQSVWLSEGCVILQGLEAGLSTPAGRGVEIVMAKGLVDLSRFEMPAHGATVEINAVMAHTEIRIPAHVPVRIQAQTILGHTELPDRATSGMGQCVFESKPFATGAPHVLLRVNNALGHLRVLELAAAEEPKPSGGAPIPPLKLSDMR